MANICKYLIRAKGTKKAALMAFASTPKAGDFDYIIGELGTDEEYVVWYQGECKWSIDAYSEERSGLSIDLSELDEEDLRDGEGYDFWDLTMRQRSEVLGLDLFVHSWSQESGFDRYDRWVNGNMDCDTNRSIDFDNLKYEEGIMEDDGVKPEFNSDDDDDDSHYVDDRIAAYEASDGHCFNIIYTNAILKEILTKYNCHSDSFDFDKTYDLELFEKKLSDYRGVKTIEELTDTLINVYLEFGTFDEGMREELINRKAEIVKGYKLIDGFSVETENEEYNDEWGWDDTLCTGYDFCIENGIFKATYREYWGGW